MISLLLYFININDFDLYSLSFFCIIYFIGFFNLYCEIIGTLSYDGDAFAKIVGTSSSGEGLRHMNECRIFHNINSTVLLCIRKMLIYDL